MMVLNSEQILRAESEHGARSFMDVIGDCYSIFIVPQLKLTFVLILKVPYNIQKCATCLDTFLRF